MKIALTEGAIHRLDLWELILICILNFEISNLQQNFEGGVQSLCSDSYSIPSFVNIQFYWRI